MDNRGRIASLHRRAIRLRASVGARFKKDERRISVAIPTYECREPAAGCLDLLAADDRIDEIVVRDDASSDDVYQAMRARVDGKSAKLRIVRNERNLGALANKWHTVRDCVNEWVLLLDSDNAVDRAYLDVLYRVRPWDPQVIYCPECARPHFDFGRWADERIDLRRAQDLLAGPDMKFATTLLNTGNYFFAREPYLRRAEGSLGVARGAPDVLVVNYAWLRSGGVLQVVRGLSYEHRKHSDSNYVRHEPQKKESSKLIRRAIGDARDLPESLYDTNHRRARRSSRAG